MKAKMIKVSAAVTADVLFILQAVGRRNAFNEPVYAITNAGREKRDER